MELQLYDARTSMLIHHSGTYQYDKAFSNIKIMQFYEILTLIDGYNLQDH